MYVSPGSGGPGAATPSASIGNVYTVETWIYPTASSQDGELISTRYPGEYSFDMQILIGPTTGYLSNYTGIHSDIGNSSGLGWLTTSGDAPYTFALNTWYQVVEVVNIPTSSYKIYVDGALISQGAIGADYRATLTDANHRVAVGGYSPGTGGATGFFTEVTLYNKALTSCRILAQYDAGNGSAQPACT